MALLVPMAAWAFSGPSVGRPSRSALRMQLVPVESEEKVRMNDFGIMQRRLGDTDLLVSECCLGGMTWGEQNTDEDAATQLNFAFDNGVNFLDTAEGYPVPMAPGTQGATDRAIGKWLKSCYWTRDQVVISTKVCGYNERYTWFRESGEGTRLTKGQILESVDASLKRLGTDLGYPNPNPNPRPHPNPNPNKATGRGTDPKASVAMSACLEQVQP